MFSAHATSNMTNSEQTSHREGDINISNVERWASLIGGGALVVSGVGLDIVQRKLTIGGAALALLGSVFIYRGATRHSYIYELLGVNNANEATRNTGSTGADQIRGGASRAATSKETSSTTVERSMKIQHSPGQLYHLWQNAGSTNKPTSPELTNMQSAEVAEKQAKELEAWNKLQQEVAALGGYIEFEDAPDGQGTIVKVVLMQSSPSSGDSSRSSGQQQIIEDLYNFKELVEAAAVPNIEVQPYDKSVTDQE